ncbi:hypothetical protein [Cetobacterium sp.]|uniref:hypothetical protein n=1 Tax=Cetobacterium sp. TaxID=2071632 RepID=UPI003F391B36
MKKLLLVTSIILSMTTYANTTKTTKPVQTKASSINFDISTEELTKIGEQIFFNEASSKTEKLVWWNDGEDFPSLGIGHFIWYPEGYNGPFDESLPKLKEYYISKGTKLPKILADNKFAPWKNKTEMEAKRNTPEFKELIDFFNNTKDIQVTYIFRVRLTAALGKMLEKTENKKHIQDQFKRIAMSTNGLYPLIDYVNFKGEGVMITERYKSQGWGLLQVLEEMKGTTTGQAALDEFSRASIVVLTNRVKNSPSERGENRWLPGWTNRCNTYKTFR